MAADPHVVGRVEESDIDQIALADHLAQELGVPAVAAADDMLAEPPDVARPGPRNRWHGRDQVVLGILARTEQQVEFAGRETGDGQVESDIQRGELAELHLEQVEIPPGAEGDLVVGEAKGAPLRLGQANELNRRHLGEAHRLRRQ